MLSCKIVNYIDLDSYSVRVVDVAVLISHSGWFSNHQT